jgi:uncharacterized protein (DUF302 family)
MTQLTAYSFGTRVPGTVAAVRPRVEAGLKLEGFGVLTEIDVQATLKRRLDVEGTPYLILGACNPTLAHRALSVDASVGALLPCNVVVRQDGPDTIVEAMDPMAALGLIDDPAIQPIAAEARERLTRVIAGLAVSS